MPRRQKPGAIRVGIGGWNYEPWRGVFYPPGLARKRELAFASRCLTSIEINSTYYGRQKRESFRRWREETPDGFVFALKAIRFATNRRRLAEAAPSIERFLESGVAELKDKLGPINWQFHPTKRFEPEDFEAFLQLLPGEVEGVALRHAVEVRHESFRVPEFVALVRRHGIAVVVADSDKHPQIADLTSRFVYARLQQSAEGEAMGYPSAEIDRWAARAQEWAAGREPRYLAPVAGAAKGATRPREVFIYMIDGFKPKAPAAARALIERLERK